MRPGGSSVAVQATPDDALPTGNRRRFPLSPISSPRGGGGAPPPLLPGAAAAHCRLAVPASHRLLTTQPAADARSKAASFVTDAASFISGEVLSVSSTQNTTAPGAQPQGRRGCIDQILDKYHHQSQTDPRDELPRAHRAAHRGK